ncbi:heme exporter protein D [Microbacterium sp. W4I20]|nr:heme exporter protein D [Microbacterium sp. W4I20]
MYEEWLAYDGGMENFWLAAAWSILPTIGVSVVFFFVLRGILRSDRTERKVHARIEAEERAARGLPPRV